MCSQTPINPNASQLSVLASKLIPMLEHAKQEHRQDYHYRYLLGTMRYILENLQDEKKEQRKRDKCNPKSSKNACKLEKY